MSFLPPPPSSPLNQLNVDAEQRRLSAAAAREAQRHPEDLERSPGRLRRVMARFRSRLRR